MSFVVGKFLGTNALAAVTSSGTLIFLMVNLFMGIANGEGVIISRFFGAGDKKQVSNAFGHLFILSSGASIQPYEYMKIMLFINIIIII